MAKRTGAKSAPGTVTVQSTTTIVPAAQSAGPRMVEMLPLSLRADVVPQSVNDEARTVELVFTTGAPVLRYDWMSDKRYLETLSLDPAHVRLDRLNDGGPLLDSHSSWSVSDQLGAVVPGSVVLMKKEGRARVRFSKREAVAPIWQDVRDGIIRSVSVGYRVYKFEEEAGKNNALPVRKAIDWEPYEVSMVSMPADAGAKVRDGHSADANQCQIVTRAAGAQEQRMENDETPSETIVERNPLDPPAGDPPTPTEPNERDEGAAQERDRVQGIRQACMAGRMTRAFEDRLIADGVDLVEAQKRVFAELAKRDIDVPRGSSRPVDARVVGDDPLVHVREGIENALLHRSHPRIGSGDKAVGFELTDKGRPYRGMSLLRIAEAYLSARGIRTTAFGKMELAGLALGLGTRAGMHTTSDFALLLADVVNKTLRQAYEESPQTFGPIVRRTTIPDFKEVKRLQLGESPALVKVEEHGEFTHGTIGEGREKYALATYGRVFAITRKALVNDDLDAFSRTPTGFGRQARNLESDLVWQQITTNPNMGDGVALFQTATHANLAAAGGVIDVTTIGAGRASMRKQKGLDGTTHLNLKPVFLIVPAEKETIADQFINPIQPQEAGKVNPFAGKLSVIAEPRLDANSLTAWYLAADPMQIDVLELAFLEGENGPSVESRVGFDVDGLEVKARHDVAAKAIDWRGLYKNPGL